MKVVTLFILSVIFSFSAFSQDTLYTIKGKTINGKVFEITQHEIKYKSDVNSEGPLYVIDKSEIVLIQYRNGTKEVFENSPTVSEQTSTSEPAYVNRRSNVNVFFGALPYINWGWGWGRSWSFWGGHGHHWHHSHHGNLGHFGRR